jgi:hypothetical protein
MTARRALALALLVGLASGCALLRPDRGLAEADASAARGEYQVALAAYDRHLKDHPDDERARAIRALMADLMAARAELAALRERAPARDAELARLRQELTARQAEVSRLREDLEALKRTDLQMERRRR